MYTRKEEKMGNVKSFRMSDRIENMFDSLKTHYSKEKKIADSDIISEGIELQFERESKYVNSFFRNEFLRYLKMNEANKLFSDICDLLEVVSISDGLFLKDEFKLLMYAFYGEGVHLPFSDSEKVKGDSNQYIRIKNLILSKETYNEEYLRKIETAFENYYEENEK